MVYANIKLDRTGLGNKLFPWARGVAFCVKSGAVMLAPQWRNYWSIGTVFRRDRNSRFYFNDFTNNSYVSGMRKVLANRCLPHISEYAIKDIPALVAGPSCVVDFAKMKDLFDPFLDCQKIVHEHLHGLVNPKIREDIDYIPENTFIGVHIRRGDFRIVGNMIEDGWYIRAIKKALTTYGRNFPIWIFSDAPLDELGFLRKEFPLSKIMPSAPAVKDIFLLSKAAVIIGTGNSTFSMWATYLGQKPSIWKSGSQHPKLYVGRDQSIFID